MGRYLNSDNQEKPLICDSFTQDEIKQLEQIGVLPGGIVDSEKFNSFIEKYKEQETKCNPSSNG